MNKRVRNGLARCLALTLLLVQALTPVAPAQAQDISVLRDAETEAFLHQLCDPVAQAAGLNPNNIQYVIVNDPTLNAFVATGQYVYVHTGFLLAVGSTNEIQGVVAHELGHMTGGDSIRSGDQIKKSSTVSILSLIAGAAAIAAGAAEAGLGLMGLGQNAAVASYLSYSRQQESSADQSGRRYLRAAGLSSQGMANFFKRIQTEQYRAGYSNEELYGGTHPVTSDRLASLRDYAAQDPYWTRQSPPEVEARLRRIQAKLYSYVAEPKDTLNRYPPADHSVPGRYARSYAYHKEARMDQAMAEIDSLLAQSPNDPYFEEVRGQILLEAGRPAEAIPVLRDATRNSGNNPLIATLFGHALMATDDPAYYGEARSVLRSALSRDPDNGFAWYQLGKIYSETGDNGRAALASAEQRYLEGDARGALTSAEMAERLLPTGSPDWLRAQDIVSVAREALGPDERRRRDREKDRQDGEGKTGQHGPPASIGPFRVSGFAGGGTATPARYQGGYRE